MRTSNPGAGLFQDLSSGGQALYRHVAEEVVKWNAPTRGETGLGDVGAVVGATHPARTHRVAGLDAGRVAARARLWHAGRERQDVRAAYLPSGLGAIVNSSRGITFPFEPDDPVWESKIVAAAKRAQSELQRDGAA